MMVTSAQADRDPAGAGLLGVPARRSAAAPRAGATRRRLPVAGRPLLPQLGNGGYDAKHYRIELDYDPEANRFDSARTTIRARATSSLSSFSLDFQDDLEVTG